MNSTSPAETILNENDNNLKCELIRRSRSVKLYYPDRYAKILADHDIIDGQLYKLSIEKLQELVKELENGGNEL